VKGFASSFFDRGRRECTLFCVLATLLVLVRSFVPTYYESFFFDSDQAIVGLMAKHLSDGRRFPLFYYGLNYMLGVEAWVIAPFFWLARPSVAVMRMPLILMNILVAVWLVAALSRRLALRPAMAFVAALPFVVPTPAVGSHLLEAAGACVEPFVYVLVLWQLRHRALAFGAALGLGFLHREFTVYAIPALAIVEARRGSIRTRDGWRRVALAAAGFAVVWLVIDDLRMHLSGEPLALQAASLRGQMCFAPRELGARAVSVVTHALPVLFGGAQAPLVAFRMNTPFAAGHPALGWLVGAALIVIFAQLIVSRPRVRAPGADSGFGAYLMWVGVFAACAYPLSCNLNPGDPPILRYLLIALLLPVGSAAMFLGRGSSQHARTFVATAFVLWAGVNLFDHVRLIRASAIEPPWNDHRVLADYLVNNHIRYARATYWDAYKLDFLTRERVTVASVDVARIDDYQRGVDAHADAAVTLARQPCSGGPTVASWCVQPPAR
jgi:hypothetical protein